MDIREQIKRINSLQLSDRTSHLDALLQAISDFRNTDNTSEALGLEIINCLGGMRTWGHIDSDVDMKILDAALSVARKFNVPKRMLEGLLKSALYYSTYYPNRYNSAELEAELSRINKTK